MQTTRKITMLIALFVVVFAVMFVLAVVQAAGYSVQAHPPATLIVYDGGSIAFQCRSGSPRVHQLQ
jgi:hypothetical protein